MEMEMPESTDIGGSFLQSPGRYHFGVLDVDEQPINKKASELLDGFRVSLSVLEGPEKNHQIDLMFFNPGTADEGTEKGREMARRKQTRFAISVGVLQASHGYTPDRAKPGERVSVDMQQARGRQLVAEVEPGKDPKFLQLAWANIWHVDDPAVADVPKSQAALKLLPDTLRRTVASFAKMEESMKPSSGGGQQAAAPIDVDSL